MREFDLVYCPWCEDTQVLQTRSFVCEDRLDFVETCHFLILRGAARLQILTLRKWNGR